MVDFQSIFIKRDGKPPLHKRKKKGQKQKNNDTVLYILVF